MNGDRWKEFKRAHRWVKKSGMLGMGQIAAYVAGYRAGDTGQQEKQEGKQKMNPELLTSLQKLQKAAEARSTRLDVVSADIRGMEGTLQSCAKGLTAHIDLPSGQLAWGLSKTIGPKPSWRILFDDGKQTKPLIEWSVQTREAAFVFLPVLLDAITEQINRN